MQSLEHVNVVIVDPDNYGGYELRSSFVGAGATTHVVRTLSAATQLVECKKIDAAIVEFSTDRETADFCNTLAELSIPCIYTSEPPGSERPRRNSRSSRSDIVSAIRDVLAQHAGQSAAPPPE